MVNEEEGMGNNNGHRDNRDSIRTSALAMVFTLVEIIGIIIPLIIVIYLYTTKNKFS